MTTAPIGPAMFALVLLRQPVIRLLVLSLQMFMQLRMLLGGKSLLVRLSMLRVELRVNVVVASGEAIM